MKNKKDIILFVNDSYFSYLLSKELIENNYNEISLIIFSKSTTNSLRKIWKIFKKVPMDYFFYRLAVQILSKTFYYKKSVQHLADKYNIQKCYVANNIELKIVLKKNAFIGFAFNFDIVFKENILSIFKNGIYNIHASKLPKDKGISPVLWAFARGDQHIWSTIYKIDEGLDSGPIVKQIQISVNSYDTSFSLYKRVCIESGSALNILLNNIYNNQIKLFNQNSELESNYFSWPDKNFELMMNKSNRKFIHINDLINKKYLINKK